MARFAVIQFGKVSNIAEADEPLFDNWIADDGNAKIGGTWDGQQFLAPISPALAIQDYTAAVQRHLDAKATERNYDGILSVCTYATSGIPKFAAEGKACVAWRDMVWEFCYQFLAEVQAGTREPPTIAELLALLPAMNWPDVQ
jgi:hypothetical protein